MRNKCKFQIQLKISLKPTTTKTHEHFPTNKLKLSQTKTFTKSDEMTTIKRQQWKQATINDNNSRCRSGKSGLLTGNG